MFEPRHAAVRRERERKAFIFGAPMVLLVEKAYSKPAVRHRVKTSNNLLAAEPESENDAAGFFALLIFSSIEVAAIGDDKRILEMIKAFVRVKSLAPLLAATFALTAPAFAQAPTQAQRDAVKSKCRSDYIAHCSSVPPGGEASLECLQKNMSSLSASCQGAVRAIGAPAAATAQPAAATPAKSAAPAAAKPAAKSGGATAAATPAAAPAAPAAPAVGAAPAAAPAVIVQRPLRPREELFVLRSACSADVRTVCGGVAPGGGRIVQCLATNAGQLSPACREVLAPFAAAR